MSFPKRIHIPPFIRIALPPHVREWNRKFARQRLTTVEEQMEQAIGLATENVRTGSGGPFGALIVHIPTNRVLCGATNVVVAENQGWAHAEAMSVALAQKTLGVFILPADEYRMVSSAQMCIGCWGLSMGWNLSEIVASVRGSDVERLTPFGEGRLPRNWRSLLRGRRTTYRADLLRRQGLVPLQQYGKRGVAYYNAGAQSGST